MSYDLGCFAECLECELCPKPDDDDELDLDLPEDYDDFDDVPPTFPEDWEPEEEGSDDPWDGWETPGVDLPGGGRGTPDWNDGPGFNLEWEW